jgi:uncharacterized protein
VTDRAYLVLHGWQNHRPPGHWEYELVAALRLRGEQVRYPQLTDPDEPSPAAWTGQLLTELAELGTGERVVVAHSLSVLLWMHAASLVAERGPVDRLLLVAPPSQQVLARFPEVADWAALAVDPPAVSTSARSVRLVCSDDDPYCPEGARAAYPGLASDVDLLPGEAHLDLDAGYGEWPSVLAWCLDGTVRVEPRQP